MTSGNHVSLTGKKNCSYESKTSNKIETQLLLYGAIPIVIPTIEITDPPDSSPINRVFAEGITPERTGGFPRYGRLKYEWIIFTSANGVERFINHRDDWIRHHSSGDIGLNELLTLFR